MKLVYAIGISLLTLGCSKKQKVEIHIPATYSGITKFDLPRMKTKLLSWELISNHLFSDDNNDNRLDFSVDINRPAYFAHNKHFDTLSLFFPIDDIKQFESTLEKLAIGDITQLNEYQVVQIEPFYNLFKYAIWNSEVAILSSTKNGFSRNLDTNKTAKSLSSEPYDISSILLNPIDSLNHSLITQHTDFEDGHLSTIIDGDEGTRNFIINALAEKITNKNTLCFTTDSCILGISTKIEPEVLDNNIHYIMPYLQQYGLIFNDQYERVKPYFDGRIYFGLSKLKVGKGLYPEAKIVFGVTEDYIDAFDTTDLKDMKPCPDSDYLVDEEEFQYILPKTDYIIYSNHNESNTGLLNRPTILNFQVNKDLINEELFSIPRSYFGNDLVDNFPFSNIEFDIHERSTHLESVLIIKCKDKKKNSLETILNYIDLIKNREEI